MQEGEYNGSYVLVINVPRAPRIFGYDRGADLVRIYIPESLYKLFVDINKANEIIVKQVDAGIDTCQIIYL